MSVDRSAIVELERMFRKLKGEIRDDVLVQVNARLSNIIRGGLVRGDRVSGSPSHALWSSTHTDVNAADTPADGDVVTWDQASGKWIAAQPPGSGSGGPSDAEYVTTSSHVMLSAEVVIPGLAGSADIARAAGAGTAEEFDTPTDPFTWSPDAPATHDADTTIKSHLYLAASDVATRFGLKAWSPAGAFDARMKASIGTDRTTTSGFYRISLAIHNSDSSVRLECDLASDPSNTRHVVRARTFASGSYTSRGSLWVVTGKNDLYLRIARDGGGNVSWYWSANGLVWQRIATLSFAITVASLGVAFVGDIAENYDAAVDWLRTDV